MKLKPIASNMTELHLNNGTVVLFSYETPVAAYKEEGFEQVAIGDRPFRFQAIKTDKKWSATTTRHINKFLNILKIGENTISVDQSVLDELVGSK